MRVSESFSQSLFLSDLRQVRARLDKALATMSSGVRVRYGSDDPEAAGEIVALGDEVQKLTMRRNGLSQARPWLAMSEQAVKELGTALDQALTFAVQGAGTVLQPPQRMALASQVDGLIKQVEGLRETQIAGRFIFGGTRSDAPPFDADGNYLGNSSVMTVPSDNVPIQVNMPGDEVFGTAATGPLAALKQLSAALKTGNAADVQPLIDTVKQAVQSNAITLARVGNNRKALEDADLRLADRQLAVKTRVHDLGAADLAQAISEVTQYQQNHEATLAAGARLHGPTFFDYLG